MVIHKYILPAPINGFSSVYLCKDAEILSVGMQVYDIVIWVRNPDSYSEKDYVKTNLQVVNTGQKAQDWGDFLGTVTTPNGIVWHVFK